MLQLTHPSWVKDWSNSQLVLTLKNDSQVSFFGVDKPDKIGSIELTMALLDEAHEINAEGRTMITGRLSGNLPIPRNFSSLPPYLQAYIQGTKDLRQSVLACNPKSKGHSLYKNFIASPLSGHVAYTSNSLNNPNLPPSYLLQQLAQYVRDPVANDSEWLLEEIRRIRDGEADPAGLHLAPYLTVFGQRNLLGQWVSAEGAIWAIDPSKHFVTEALKNPEGYFASIDWGFAHPRILITAYRGEAYQTVDYWGEGDSTPGQLINEMKAFERKYELVNVFCPPDEPGLIRELKAALATDGIVRKARNQVLAGINSVSSSLAEGNLNFLNAPQLFRDEITGYEWKPDGDAVKDEPLKQDDHYPDALRYGIYTHKFRNRV
jgi:hypothetical protein